MKLNGVPIFDKSNIPLFVLVALTMIFLVKTENTNILFVLVPLIYIFRERLSQIYIQTLEEPTTKVVSEGGLQRIATPLSDNYQVILSKIRPYRKYSPSNYRKGKQYLKMFNHTLDDITRKTTAYTSKQLFQNAEEYLRISLNHFQSISFSVPEMKHSQILRYGGKPITSIVRDRIGKLCKRLHEVGYQILYNYSHNYDIEFRKNPNIYSGEHAYSTDNVYESNRFLEHELH
jgi:hypothetical protein